MARSKEADAARKRLARGGDSYASELSLLRAENDRLWDMVGRLLSLLERVGHGTSQNVPSGTRETSHGVPNAASYAAVSGGEGGGPASASPHHGSGEITPVLGSDARGRAGAYVSAEPVGHDTRPKTSQNVPSGTPTPEVESGPRESAIPRLPKLSEKLAPEWGPRKVELESRRAEMLRAADEWERSQLNGKTARESQQ